MDPQHVLITGASSGIGEGVAYQYASRGARLGLFARREERLEAVAARCIELGASGAEVLVGDTTSREDIAKSIDTLDRIWPRIDRAFLNAGCGCSSMTHETIPAHYLEVAATQPVTVTNFDADVVKRTILLDYMGAVNWMDPLFARMCDQGGGSVAVMGSLAADRALPRSGAYSAAKAALRILVESLRLDAEQMNIKLTMVEPGFVESECTSPHRAVLPFIWTTEKAAIRIHRDIERGRAMVRFPWMWSKLSTLGAAMVPRGLYHRWARSKLPQLPAPRPRER